MNDDRENFRWVSYDGRVFKLEELGDTHLANILDFLSKYPKHSGNRFRPLLEEEAKLRGLMPEFLSRAQIPYMNEDSQWEIWDFEKHEPKEISDRPDHAGELEPWAQKLVDFWKRIFG